MFVMPFIAYQLATRTVCSRRRRHICVTARKAGAMLASKAPRKKRVAKSPPKLLAAAMQASVAPQRKTMALENFTNGQTDQQPGEDGLHDELGQVDDGAEPAVLGALEVGVVDEAEDGGVGEGGLIQSLQEVDGQEQGEDDQIDLPQHAFVVGGGEDDAAILGGGTGLAEQLGGGVQAMAIYGTVDVLNGLDILLGSDDLLLLGVIRRSGGVSGAAGAAATTSLLSLPMVQA